MIFPYCAIVLSTSACYFVTDSFHPSWVMTEDGKLITNWSGIRQRIAAYQEKEKVELKVFDVGRIVHFGEILQGTGVFSGNDDIKEMTRRFSLFSGKDGRVSGSARIINSLWLNSKFSQNDLKRILIDRIEADNDMGYEREPEFKVNEIRVSANDFEGGWNDYNCYVTGELPDRMRDICSSLHRFDRLKEEADRFPSVLASAIHAKRGLRDSFSKRVSELEPKKEAALSAYDEKVEEFKKRKEERDKKLGVVEDRMKSAKNNYEAYDAEFWKERDRDIEDLDNIGYLNSEKESLRKQIDVIERKSESLTKDLIYQKDSIEKELADLKVSVAEENVELINSRDNDPALRPLEQKRISVRDDVVNIVLLDKYNTLKEKEVLCDNKKESISSTEKVITKLEKGDDYVSEFISTEEGKSVSIGLGKGVFSRIFRAVLMYVCRTIFGISSFTRTDFEKERDGYARMLEDLEVAKKDLKKETEDKIVELLGEYEKQIVEIKKPYNQKIDRNNELVSMRSRYVESEVERINGLIDEIQKNAGIDLDRLKDLKHTFEVRSKRCNYLLLNREEITRLKNIRAEHSRLEEYRVRYESISKENNVFDESENKKLESLRKVVFGYEEDIKRLKGEIILLNKEFTKYDSLLNDYAKNMGYDDVHILSEIIESSALVNLGEIKSFEEYFSAWNQSSDNQRMTLSTLKERVDNLKGILSKRDYFQFSLKPTDSLVSDSDYLRVARVVEMRNDPASGQSIEAFLNAWREMANNYLRTIYKIGNNARKHKYVDDVVQKIASFINRYNSSDAIERVRFEVEDGSNNELVRIAMELTSIIDRYQINLDVVDIADGLDNSLYLFENISDSLRNMLAGVMKKFSKAVSAYEKDAIPPEDFFTVYIWIKEVDKPEVKQYDLEGVGSTGTRITSKTIVAMGLVGEVVSNENKNRKESNIVHVFLDETGRIDNDNKQLIYDICDKFNLRIFMLEPEGKPSIGDFSYRWAFEYDKATHTRIGKPVTRRLKEPKEIKDGKV